MSTLNEKLKAIYYKYQAQGEDAPVPLNTIRDFLAIEGIHVE